MHTLLMPTNYNDMSQNIYGILNLIFLSQQNILGRS